MLRRIVTLAEKKAIDQEWEALCALKMNIDHVSGKEAIELTKEKRQ